jgi:3-oxoacyl-[acyl-carrier protein] reductase
MDNSLQGRVALVTGASGGIGRALATRLAEAGCHLALAYGSDEAGVQQTRSLIADFGVHVTTLAGDLSDPLVAQGLVAETAKALGTIDVLVLNAGSAGQRDWWDVDLALWERTIAVNLRAPFLLCQTALPGMIERGFGRVLAVSSVAAYTGGVVGPHYAASKAGLNGLVHYFAGRTASAGVTVNGIAPALIEETGMLPRAPDGGPPLPIPVGRLGKPDEVADLGLAMLRNGYLTNQVVLLDGGLHPQ